MNEPPDKRIIIASYYLHPGTEIGGVRAHNLAQSLSRLGHEVLVITAEPAECVECLYTRLTVLDPTRRTLINRALLVPDRMEPWARLVWEEMRDKQLLRDDDVLITSSWPFSSHLLGLWAREISWPGRWIAEFRDPWTTSPYYFRPGLLRRRRERALESRIMHSADTVVTVTEGVARMLEKEHDRPVECLYSPIPDQSSRATHDSEPVERPLSIVHAGSLYSGRRDTRGFLKVIADLVGSGEVRPGDLVAHFLGRPDRRLIRWVDRLHLTEFVRIHGLVPREEVRPWMEAADVLLVVRWPDKRDAPFLPAKIFEYLSYRKPILIVNAVDGGEAEKLVCRVGAGMSCRSAGEIRAALLNWMTEKRHNGTLTASHDEALMLQMGVQEFGHQYERLLGGDMSHCDA